MTKQHHEAMTFLANKMLFLGGAFAVAFVIAICSGTSDWLINICAGGTILMVIPGVMVRQFLAGVEIIEEATEEESREAFLAGVEIIEEATEEESREAFLRGKAFEFWNDPEENVYEDATLNETYDDPGDSNPHSV
jgi:hypothetical protein